MTKRELPELIDSHCHLEMDAFDGDRDDVIGRARHSGVTGMLTVGTDQQGAEKAIRIAEAYDEVWAAVGLHPHDARTADEGLWNNLRQWLEHPKVVAVGETGLDYHYDHSPREVQKEIFRRHLDLARDTDMPVIVHSRTAEDDTMDILRRAREEGAIRGVLHCFSGGARMATEALELGFLLSIAGPVTFKNAEEHRAVVRSIPVESLLVETDSPYLSPVPMRGRRNEPAYVRYTVEAIAECMGLSFHDVARITTLNARRLFGLASPEEPGRIAYPIRDSLYLNITNRCTNRCGFCAKFRSFYVKGHNLRLQHEPSAQEIIAAIDKPRAYREIVFCGFGEPLLRIDVVVEVARWVKAQGGRVRINTNGLSSQVHGRDVLDDLVGIVDAFSVSLDAHDAETYERLCRPQTGPGAFEAVQEFIRRAAERFTDVTATVVDAPEVDVELSRRLAEGLGAKFRVRTLNLVG